MSFRVAVFWPKEGYGCPDDCKTLAEVEERIKTLLKLGYGKPHCPIHVFKITKLKLIREINGGEND